MSLGLADAIGDLRSTLRARYGEKVLTPVIAPPAGCCLACRPPVAGGGRDGVLDGIGGLPEE